MLNLSRNLGLITGASVMGAIFSFASGTGDITTAPADAISAGMRFTFAIAGLMIAGGLAITVASRLLARRLEVPDAAS
jgi:hypothetical protein